MEKECNLLENNERNFRNVSLFFLISCDASQNHSKSKAYFLSSLSLNHLLVVFVRGKEREVWELLVFKSSYIRTKACLFLCHRAKQHELRIILHRSTCLMLRVRIRCVYISFILLLFDIQTILLLLNENMNAFYANGWNNDKEKNGGATECILNCMRRVAVARLLSATGMNEWMERRVLKWRLQKWKCDAFFLC